MKAFISNATAYPVTLDLEYQLIEVSSVNETQNAGVSASINPTSPGLLGKFLNNVSTSLKKKKVDSSYLIPPYSMRAIQVKSEKGRRTLKTISVEKKGEVVFLDQKLPVYSEEDVRCCIWEEGEVPRVNELAEGQFWRFAWGIGIGRNYPKGYKCEDCLQEVRCLADCVLYKKYGGLGPVKKRKESENTIME